MSATRYSEAVVGHGRLSNNSFEVLVLNLFISLLEGFHLATVFYCRLGCIQTSTSTTRSSSRSAKKFTNAYLHSICMVTPTPTSFQRLKPRCQEHLSTGEVNVIIQMHALPYASLHYTYNRNHSNHSTKVSGWWVMVQELNHPLKYILNFKNALNHSLFTWANINFK